MASAIQDYSLKKQKMRFASN